MATLRELRNENRIQTNRLYCPRLISLQSHGPDQESIVLDVDPRSVIVAIKQANTAVEGWEQGTVGAGERMQKSLERMSEMLVKVNDRSRSLMERLTQSIEKQAAAYGKTEVERLIAGRDRSLPGTDG